MTNHGMKPYKVRLLRALREAGWELSDIVDPGTDWRLEDSWVIRSTRQQWGLEVTIRFFHDDLMEYAAPWSESIDAGVIDPESGEFTQWARLHKGQGLMHKPDVSRFLDALDTLRE